MKLYEVIDFTHERSKRVLGSAMQKAMRWPERGLPMVPNVKERKGIFLSLWILSTQENVYTLGPFKSIDEAVNEAKAQMEKEELEDAGDTPGYFDLQEIKLRRPRNAPPVKALTFGEDEALFFITKDFVPTRDMVFSHEGTRAFSPGKEILDIQDQIAEIEGRIKQEGESPFLQRRLAELIDKLESLKR